MSDSKLKDPRLRWVFLYRPTPTFPNTPFGAPEFAVTISGNPSPLRSPTATP